MKYLKTINELNENRESIINEKKVTYKRKYTDNYPAKRASTSARVRNAVFTAMKDGIISEDEMQNIFKEMNTHKRWLSRNSNLFKIEEDSEGKKTYRLSKHGSRIYNKTLES